MTKLGPRTTIHTLNGDSLTPILIFRRLDGSHKFLLESSAKHESSGRYSFIGCTPRKTYVGSNTLLTEYVSATEKTYTHEGNLHVLLKRLMPRVSNVTQFPFSGGAIGYIRPTSAGELPQVNFNIYETIIVFDHLTDEVTIIHTNIDAEAKTPNLEAIAEQITQGTAAQFEPFALQQDQHYTGHAFSAYRKLRKTKASAYMYYVEFNDHTIIGTAPESLIHVAHATIRAHIMTGSVTKSTSYQENAVLINDLRQQPTIAQQHQQSITERIEQLKRVSNAASVQIIKDAAPLYSNQHIHLHAVVEAQLSSVLHPIDALTACTHHTNALHGAVGYIGFNGQLDFTEATESFIFTQHTVRTTAQSLQALQAEQEVIV